MPTGASILAKIDKALNKVANINKVAYKRVITTSGDTLIGNSTSTSVDTIMAPQPIAIQAGREHLSGQRDQVETIISPSGIRLSADDYVITVSANALSDAELQNSSLVLVLKNADGSEAETLFIMDSSDVKYQGVELLYQIYARSVKTL